VKLIDAHTHIGIGQEQQYLALAGKGLWQLPCATKPEECRRIADLAVNDGHMIPTFGLHLWYAQDYPPDAMDMWLAEADIVGEIGLDSVWAPAPVEVQMEAFVHQLQLAHRLRKCVILHTKGAEGTILKLLEQYSLPGILVHWYSGDEKQLDGYIELGCYFTLGPDLGVNPDVQTVCRKAPPDRLLTETDGTGAVEWALGKPCDVKDIPGVLASSLVWASQFRGVSMEEMRDTVYDNMMRFLKTAGINP
jgi:TatD DNase family protein